MAKSKRVLHDNLRAKFMEKAINVFSEAGEDVLLVGSNKIAMPCVDEEGNEEYIVLTFSIPTGTRDGKAYNGHDERDAYAFECEEKAKKAKKEAEAKAKKIAKDKAAREAKKTE